MSKEIYENYLNVMNHIEHRGLGGYFPEKDCIICMQKRILEVRTLEKFMSQELQALIKERLERELNYEYHVVVGCPDITLKLHAPAEPTYWGLYNPSISRWLERVSGGIVYGPKEVMTEYLKQGTFFIEGWEVRKFGE